MGYAPGVGQRREGQATVIQQSSSVITARDSLPGEHPLREALVEELHARPVPLVAAPVRVSHLATLCGSADEHADHRHLGRLAAGHGVEPPDPGSLCWYMSFPGFDLRWEKHTEFSTYTFVRPGLGATPFSDTALELLPEDWLREVPGQTLVAAHVTISDQPAPDPFGPELEASFDGQMIFGSRIVDDRATLWTSLRLHEDGFSRFLLYSRGLSDFQAGRTLQRVLEIETYRLMALLAFPEAKRIWPRVKAMDEALAELIDTLARAGSPEDEKQLLGEITRISQAIEHMRSDTNFRFSATRAYMAIVNRRLNDLREQKFPGRSTVSKFLERRLGPAIRTCESVESHLQDLSLRVARATETLRARIETSIEDQNRSLLESMNRRSHQQVRLQETVEGLSVAAISYYLIGLIRYGLEGLTGAGWRLHLDLVTGLLVVPVFVGVWGLVRWRRRRILGRG